MHTAYLERMVRWLSGKAKDIAVHGGNNKIKVISAIYIVSQNHGVPVNVQRSELIIFAQM